MCNCTCFLVIDIFFWLHAERMAASETQSLIAHGSINQQRWKCLSMHAIYRFPKISERGAIYMLILNLLFTMSLTTCGSDLLYGSIAQIECLCLLILCPVIGLLSDCWTGRFKVLKAAIYFQMVAVMLKGITIITTSPVAVYAAVAAWTLSFACYGTCIIQFTTDQLIGASGEELSFAIYWLLWGLTTSDLISRGIGCVLLLPDQQYVMANFVVSAASFIACFIMIENCSHVLMTKPQLSNPIKHIAKVLNYARKHKFPERRSALTYWEEDYPSRIDLGKDKYGGPFTFEEVEDVKTFLRLIPMVLCIAMFAIGYWHKGYHNSKANSGKCYSETNISSGIAAFFVAALGLPAYHFVIYPFFYNYIPSMLRRIGLGMLIMAVSFLCNSIIEVVGHMENGNVTCVFSANAHEGATFPVNYLWTLIPSVLNGVGVVMVAYSTFEFVIAQTPCQMKGLAVSLLLESVGIFTFLGEFIIMIFLSFPFEIFPSCGFYYHMTFLIIMLATLLLFVFVSKWYKLRQRDDIVPFHSIAENYFEKNYYLEQRYLKRYYNSVMK